MTAAASFASPGNPGGGAFLKQAGVKAEELRLANVGMQGNGHMMMVERNNREVLKPITEWIDKNVSGSAPAIRKRSTESTALKLATATPLDWRRAEKMPYGTILSARCTCST